MHKLFNWLNRNQDIGLLLLRLFIAIRLIYGVIDNVLSWDKMMEFEKFLSAFGLPFPLASAVISVYAQLIAGIAFLLGWKVRYAALLMIFNFTIAILMVHLDQSFEEMTPALALLFISILILFTGAGKYGFDMEILPEQR